VDTDRAEDPLEVLNWHLRRAMEELDEARSVALLREAGASWQTIGEALGTTRQAAQMRFGKAKIHRG
jgi:uncharacterized protein with PIN domain